MNALERTLIEKAGYDNGWEVVVESRPEQVALASALHRLRALVRPDSGGRWLLTIPGGALAAELVRAIPGCSAGGSEFQAATDSELGNLLRHAARLARALPNQPEVRFAESVERELAQVTAATEVERVVRQRLGQSIYRESLMDYWGGACAVTGIRLPALLRASHAKAWAECETDAERLNVFNGFLLVAHLDALFDRRLMTFSDQGEAVFAPAIDESLRQRLGLKSNLRLRWLSPQHKPFLAWHLNAFNR
jgi:putative restriction endonuclease